VELLAPVSALSRPSGRSPSPTPRPPPQNELGVLEFIHALVETLDKYFENVCELDIMFNLEKAHFILDEMITNGCVVETNKGNVLKPILLLEKVSAGK
jgi:AP-4 complex subunit sigma-1